MTGLALPAVLDRAAELAGKAAHGDDENDAGSLAAVLGVGERPTSRRSPPGSA